MPKKLKTSAKNRKCIYPNCNHLLSIYNHDDYCHVHRDQMSRERNRKVPYHHPS